MAKKKKKKDDLTKQALDLWKKTVSLTEDQAKHLQLPGNHFALIGLVYED